MCDLRVLHLRRVGPTLRSRLGNASVRPASLRPVNSSLVTHAESDRLWHTTGCRLISVVLGWGRLSAGMAAAWAFPTAAEPKATSSGPRIHGRLVATPLIQVVRSRRLLSTALRSEVPPNPS
jgi:hypothetical protein